MPKVKINDHQIHYEVHGEGVPLLLIAGFTCSSLFWNPILRKLTPHFKVITLDNLGCGKSDCPDIPYSIETLADQCAYIIQQLGLKKVHVLGHSMGGTIAQTFAFKYEHLVNHLILSNTFIKLNKVSEYAERHLLHLQEEEIDIKHIAEGVMPWVFSSDYLKSKIRVAQFIDLQIKNPFSYVGFKRQLEAMLNFDSSDWFYKIKPKTLVIEGKEDILCPHDSEKLSNKISSATLYSFPYMGHVPMIEKPKEFVDVVVEFLNG